MKPRILPIIAVISFSLVISCGDNESKKDEDSDRKPIGPVYSESGEAFDGEQEIPQIMASIHSLLKGIQTDEIIINQTPINLVLDQFTDIDYNSKPDYYSFSVGDAGLVLNGGFIARNDTLAVIGFELDMHEKPYKKVMADINAEIEKMLGEKGKLVDYGATSGFTWKINGNKLKLFDRLNGNIKIDLVKE